MSISSQSLVSHLVDNCAAFNSDLAPPRSKDALSNEAIPKGAARILNAAKVQQEYAERKRKVQDGGEDLGKGNPKKKRRRTNEEGGKEKEKEKIKIKPGESMAHFSR